MKAAAIYARKSTEQTNTVDEAKSVGRQIEGGRRFITSQGWTLDEAHIYTDDGVSGALFENRGDFRRMMRDADARAFDVIVFYDLDRFGRDGRRTMEELYKLADLGVGVYDYSNGQAVSLDSFEGRLTTSLKAEFAQQYREQVRKHTRAALRRKVEQGYVAGGKVFGYDNHRIGVGQVKREICDSEAAIVRDIYRRFAAGEGLRTIAGALNRAGVAAPRAQRGRPSGWSLSPVRAVLARPLYRGEVVYGCSAKAYGSELRKALRDTNREKKGQVREKGQISKPEEDWIRVPAPHLAIIDAALAQRVDARRQHRQAQYVESLRT